MSNLAGIAPFLMALFLSLALGGPVIKALKARNSVQPISPDAPEKHRLKHGTPTMGGLLILATVTLTTVTGLICEATGWMNFGSAWRPLDYIDRFQLAAVLIAFLLAGGIGFLDDLGKARKKENKAGLSERAKLMLQFAIAIGFAFFLNVMAPQSRYTTLLPLGAATINLGWLYYPLAVLFIVGFSNAVNFTDGLDGLASGTTLIVAGTLAAGSTGVAPEIITFYLAIAGACAGFLWFNAFPARVFMGDTGALALGVGLACAALVTKQETLLLIVGAVYLAEIASMMLQRYVFKYRRIRFGIEYAKANRVFRRAPLHHHFEELGWYETQVVIRFWIVTMVACLIGLTVLPDIEVRYSEDTLAPIYSGLAGGRR